MACSLARGLEWTKSGGLDSSCGHRLRVLRLWAQYPWGVTARTQATR